MSLQSPFSPTIVCRPALPIDTPQVLELCSHIWEGHDYIPYVWEAWLAEPGGQLAVAEYGGRVVGLAKLTYLSPGQWWLEGLRVHPDFEGRGIASHLNDYLLDIWNRSGGGVVRMTTSAQRVKVHRLGVNRGFVKIGEYTVYGAPAIQEPMDSFSPLLPEEIQEAIDMVLHSPVLPLQNGLMDYGWRWGSPGAEGLETAAKAGRAWWWQGRRGLLAFWEDEDESRKYLVLHLIACPLEAMPACLLDYRRMAASLGYAHVEWNIPLNPELLVVVQKGGFTQSWDEVLFMFEKKSH
jgi:GNAT superfamily N-acetyltransferase